ncbi:MAG: hypothetical protein AAFX50_05495 [Acidobacteriota bacterium]
MPEHQARPLELLRMLGVRPQEGAAPLAAELVGEDDFADAGVGGHPAAGAEELGRGGLDDPRELPDLAGAPQLEGAVEGAVG